MEMIVKDGLVKDNNGKKEIAFLETNNELDEKFKKSFGNVVSLIDGYDIGKCTLNKEKDIFYLYSFHTNYDDIENTLFSAINGNQNDILNKEETSLIDSIINKNNNSIFWDVKNDLIIVIGLDNLKTLLLQLERKRWECIKIQNENFMNRYIELCASGVYKKVMKKNDY